MIPTSDNTGQQVFWLLILAIPIACIARTVVFEEVFREPRDYCHRRSRECPTAWQRKFFYLFTCEYCFSHYVAAGAVLITGYRLLLPDWRGGFVAWFTLVWIANVYMSLFGRLRLDIKRERVEIKAEELEVEREEAVKPATNAHAWRSAASARPPERPAHRA
jgi:hypothetical protein